MLQSRLIKAVELADLSSPRSARYAVHLRQLVDGYVVEVQWGGAADRKQHESYYRPTLSAAWDKFERMVAAKTVDRRVGSRQYRLLAEYGQMSFDELS